MFVDLSFFLSFFLKNISEGLRQCNFVVPFLQIPRRHSMTSQSSVPPKQNAIESLFVT
jgi:hypothetical protein